MKERCKDLIGKRVRLTRDVRTGAGSYAKGCEFRVLSTWRGLYELFSFGPPARGIRKLSRKAFEIVGDGA